MSRTVEKRQDRAKLVHKAREIVSRADEEKRAMSAEEEANYQAILAEVDALKKQIEELESVDAKKDELDKIEEELEQSRGRQVKVEERSRQPESNARLAVRNYFLKGEMRGLNLTDTDGGYMVLPVELSGQFNETVDQLVPMRNLATVTRFSNAKSLRVPNISEFDDAAWTSEVSAPTADAVSVTPSVEDLTPTKLVKLVKISKQHMRLAAQAEDFVLRKIAAAHARAEDNAYMTSTGTNGNYGLFYAHANGIPTSRDVNTGSATDFTGDGILSAIYSLKGAYRNSPNVAMISSDFGAGKLAKLKDGNDVYLWQPGLLNGEPDRIRGIKVYTSQYAPSTFTDGSYVDVIGDMSKFWIA